MMKLLCLLLLAITFQASSQTKTTVYFDFDKYDLKDEAIRSLNSVIADKTISSVEIYGHCDQLGSKEYNYNLSNTRANAVKEYLVSKGFDATRITIIKGYGKDMPLIGKLDEESRQMNRRVTLISMHKAIRADTLPKPIPTQPPVANTPARPRENVRLIEKIRDTATKTGQTIVLKNINFYPGSHRFLSMAYEPLQELLETMENVPTLVIEIQGHICCLDGQGDGLDYDTGEPFLSYNRARAVYEFLLRNGIERRRMTYKGFGHQFPIILNERNEAEKTINRRVEIRIVRK